jgi:carboxymethylenebutenolidase
MRRSFVIAAALTVVATLATVGRSTTAISNGVDATDYFGDMSGTGQDWAKQRLAKSPRHSEWVKVRDGKRTINCFVSYPDTKDKTAAVVVVHEILGLTDWVRDMTDELAEAGYIAIAPDLLSEMGPDGGGSTQFPDRDSLVHATMKLPPDQITADLTAVSDFVAKLPSCNHKVIAAGFGWGGGQAFRFATNRMNLKAAFVFYGAPADKASMARIKCTVYGFYGSKDERITPTVGPAIEAMKAAGKNYDPVTYDSAGHGFMRAGDDPGNGNVDNKKAHDDAWQRWLGILKELNH